MGLLKIDCFCNESQMDRLLHYISEYLYSIDSLSLEDIDEEREGVRICVEFGVFMDIVMLKNAEILDENWGLLYEDSAVLTSRLRKLLENYNRCHHDMRKQALEARKDQY